MTGNLSSIGSDTLATMMTAWTTQYKKIYPAIFITIQASGSSTAPPALTEQLSN
jgi:phosphate transport system substrate-binding protein